jgi:hypothetical protein
MFMLRNQYSSIYLTGSEGQNVVTGTPGFHRWEKNILPGTAEEIK